MPRSRPPRKCARPRYLNRSRLSQGQKSRDKRAHPLPFRRQRLAKGRMQDLAGTDEGAEAAVAVPDRGQRRLREKPRFLPGMSVRLGPSERPRQ
jgi:hypothetical protein